MKENEHTVTVQRLMFSSQANYSKGRITIILHIDSPKLISNESKMQNCYVAHSCYDWKWHFLAKKALHYRKTLITQPKHMVFC